MRRVRINTVIGLWLVVVGSGSVWAEEVEPEDIQLIAVGALSGSSEDQSGLTDFLGPDMPHARLGGFSAIEYRGEGTNYYVLSDRGPRDGAVPYVCRFHVLDMALPAEIPSGKVGKLQITLRETHLLKGEDGDTLIGQSSAPVNRRFDPEAMRCLGTEILWIAEEYGPSLRAFSLQGHEQRSWPVPSKFLASDSAEGRFGLKGRQPNRGFEGLALTPDGGHLLAILQGPLIQDSEPHGKSDKRRGVSVRVLRSALDSGQTQEFVYLLDDPENGVSEILAINGSRFLCLERDGRRGEKARFKKITLVELEETTTDVSRIERLPADGSPGENMRPLKKSVLIDLLDSRFGLRGTEFPEKVEGLAFGPRLPDGRLLLLVCVDNDFETNQPSWFYAFAIRPERLPDYGWTW